MLVLVDVTEMQETVIITYPSQLLVTVILITPIHRTLHKTLGWMDECLMNALEIHLILLPYTHTTVLPAFSNLGTFKIGVVIL